MKDWMKSLEEEFKKNNSLVLISVVESRGSVPRGPGAHMVVTREQTAGTIGGGNAEYLAVNRARQLLKEEKKAELMTFSMGAGQSRAADSHTVDSGMICGGEITVLLQTVRAGTDEWETLCSLGELLRDAVSTPAQPGQIPVLVLEGGIRQGIRAGLIREEVFHSPVFRKMQLPDGDWKLRYTEPLQKPGQVYIFGAGHVAKELAALLTHLDFFCAVCDCRREQLEPSAYPRGCRLICTDYENAPVFGEITGEDSICIMSHGHQYDYELLCQALNTPAAYIGVMGSRRKTAMIQKKLLEDGFGADAFERYQLPMGVPIQSDTPAEIAVSAAAELIHRRALRWKQSKS